MTGIKEAIFDEGVKLITYGDINEEKAGRYDPCHYEVWRKPESTFTGNLARDNIYTLDISDKLRDDLVERFRITKEDIVLEIGAYNGWGTVRLSKLARHVISVEADRDNCKVIQKNLAKNDIKNVTLCNVAVGTDHGHAIFYKGDHPQAKSFHGKSLRGIIDHEVIKIVPVDSFVEKATYVTMEINMGELDALYGMEELLKNNDIRLIAAGWYKLDGKPACVPMKKFLEKMGYHVIIGKINRVYAFKNLSSA